SRQAPAAAAQRRRGDTRAAPQYRQRGGALTEGKAMGLFGGHGSGNRVRRLEQELALGERELRQGRFQRSMALITAFSAVVNGFEAYAQHQRGAFDQRLMWTPVWLTPPTVAAAGGALVSERVARRLLPAIALVSIVDGVLGFVYHLKGIA